MTLVFACARWPPREAWTHRPMDRSPVDPFPLPASVTGLVQARAESDVVELSLLLPRWQVEALEDAARSSGVTVGQMIRRCLGELLRR